jgi:membrane associated rhomboid family serine protease
MPHPPPPPIAGSDPPALARPLWRALVVIALITALPELVFTLADAGLIGSPRWRPLGYQYGAFWAGLLYGWQPNFPAQPVTMFLTYALLHGGGVHLLGNLGALAWLGPRVAQGGSAARLVMIWTLSAIGGALAFGLMTTSPAPMIGASGAVSGLAGAWVVQDWQDRRHAGVPATWPALWMLALLLAINLIAWIYEDGVLAWQTHLGGTLAGMTLATVWPPPARSEAQKRKGPA